MASEVPVQQASLRTKLDQMAQSFDLEVSKIRLYCKDLAQLNNHLQSKIGGIDKMEIENLEMHMQLDAKLRALETVLKCGTDPS